MQQDLSHLQGYPGAFACMADLKVPLGDKVLPCHSAVLSMRSPILCDMFASCESTEWGAGVAAALEGCGEPARFLQLLYALDAPHSATSVKVDDLLAGVDVVEVVRTAHKLDSRALIEVSALSARM